MPDIKVTKHHIKIAVTFLMFQYLDDVKQAFKNKCTKNRIDKLIQNLWDIQKGTGKRTCTRTK
jgi:hypothetical protein